MRLINKLVAQPTVLIFTVAQSAVLCGMMMVFIGSVGSQEPGPPPRVTTSWRVATPDEERTYELQRLEDALLEQQAKDLRTTP